MEIKEKQWEAKKNGCIFTRHRAKRKKQKKRKKKVEPCQFWNIVCNMSRTQTITVLKDSTNFSSQGA